MTLRNFIGVWAGTSEDNKYVTLNIWLNDEKRYSVYLNIDNVVVYEGKTDFENFEGHEFYYINPTNAKRPFYLKPTKDENFIWLQEAFRIYVGVPEWKVLLNRM